METKKNNVSHPSKSMGVKNSKLSIKVDTTKISEDGYFKNATAYNIATDEELEDLMNQKPNFQ
jgi:hypothetical protein